MLPRHRGALRPLRQNTARDRPARSRRPDLVCRPVILAGHAHQASLRPHDPGKITGRTLVVLADDAVHLEHVLEHARRSLPFGVIGFES